MGFGRGNSSASLVGRHKPGVGSNGSATPAQRHPWSDTRGWLNGETNFSFHKHLPHHALTTEDTSAIKVLGTQPIDVSKPHPFIEAGNHEFDSFVDMPPKGKRAGEIVLADWTRPSSSPGLRRITG